MSTQDFLIIFVFLPLIGGIHGYITNKVALLLLFRPYNPIKIPLLNITFQGLIPSRQPDLARSIADVIENRLLSAEDLLGKEKLTLILDKLLPKITYNIELQIKKRLPFFVPDAIKIIIIDYIRKIIEEEADRLSANIVDITKDALQNSFKIAEIVEKKLNEFPSSELEVIAHEVAHRELKNIEKLGFIMGILIGIVQGFFLLLLGYTI
ncbi:DUF445 family protein [Bacillota bacterium LX-D]|nr:DUF445 family protein [Bacillota bacterium LX-D]